MLSVVFVCAVCVCVCVCACVQGREKEHVCVYVSMHYSRHSSL